MQNIRYDIDGTNKNREVLLEDERLPQLLADISAALARGHSLRETLNRCCEAIVENLGAAFARIWIYNEETNHLELHSSAGIYTHLDGEHSRIPLGQYKIGLIAEERKPHLTNSVVGDSRINDQEWAQREKMTAFAGYPLIVENRLIGVVAMFSRKALTEAALQSLSIVSGTNRSSRNYFPHRANRFG
jgi:GAF domain-containing protein